MKQLDVPPTRVNRRELHAAVDAVFGKRMLEKVHGTVEFQSEESFDLTRPVSTRAFRFAVTVPRVPAPIRRFFCGDKLHVTTTQTATVCASRVQVVNELQLHFKGSRFFKLHPTFWLEATDKGMALGGRVQHNAILFPPLNRIAEGFMMRSSERELLRFRACLAEDGVIT